MVDNLVRLLIALMAVLVLVAPMGIMSVHPSPAKSLIISSVFYVRVCLVIRGQDFEC